MIIMVTAVADYTTKHPPPTSSTSSQHSPGFSPLIARSDVFKKALQKSHDAIIKFLDDVWVYEKMIKDDSRSR
ncbi:hypothetical protein A359_03380 [secondary endosymbiont of Ctenarytaina eucalypti]|uniref:Uncharacterized protein n=1 Tax=secondary endosymbiont of Ctenarytaina eucalypti TaxID=1199245 RepID=J3YRM4_9ENTR|nr:hypothetical protein A359_03380 [secondary endosymbiont of Ctenarytaina eucalypti]